MEAVKTERAAQVAAAPLRIGFVPLLDAAPIIAAQELGYFADEGLRVVLERQIGWGNVRDKLTFGHLQASHALLGMPALSVMGGERFLEPLSTIISLGFGGNAISLGRRLTDKGIDSAGALAGWLKHRGASEAAPRFAHVFGCSTHQYLLRQWLEAAGINPDRDVQLCVLPPPQMAGQMAKGYLDGFCVGEPWNTQAAMDGCGKVVALTTDLVPAHPEKVLAVSRRWLGQHPEVAGAIVRAVLRAILYCGVTDNTSRLVEMLAAESYLNVPAELLFRSLTLMDRRAVAEVEPGYGVTPASAFPSATHAAWLLERMRHWRHINAETDLRRVALASVETAPYRAAAKVIGVECPADDAPPMRLRSGWFHIPSARKSVASASL